MAKAFTRSFLATWGAIHSLPLKCWLPDPEHWRGRLFHRISELADTVTVRLPEGISLMRFGLRGYRRATLLDRARWKRHFTPHDGETLSPGDVLDMIESGLCDGGGGVHRPRCIVRVQLRRRSVSLEMIPYVKTKAGAFLPLALFRATYVPDRKMARLDTVVKIPYGGREIDGVRPDAVNCVAALTRNSFLLYERLGCERIHLTAGFSKGSVVWPKYGFRPRDGIQWLALRVQILFGLARLPRELRIRAQRRLEASLRHRDARSVYWISDLSFGKLANGPARYEKLFPHGLGPALLLGHRWKGVLELKDPRARRRFARYLAKKNCPLPQPS